MPKLSWYEEFEPVFLIDYAQFGNTLRAATLEPHLERLRVPTAPTSGLVDEQLVFATAIAMQQLGHAREDMAALLAGLAYRHTPSAGFPKPPKDPLGRRALYFTLLNYRSGLSLTNVVDKRTAHQLAALCGFGELAKAAMPAGFHSSAAKWVLDGIAKYVVRLMHPKAGLLKTVFQKLKHGAVAVCEARLVNNSAPPNHIGILVPGSTPDKPTLLAIPATRQLLAETACEIERARVAINVLVALYLQRYHPGVWTPARVSFEEMLDERVRQACHGIVLIGGFEQLVPVQALP